MYYLATIAYYRPPFLAPAAIEHPRQPLHLVDSPGTRTAASCIFVKGGVGHVANGACARAPKGRRRVGVDALLGALEVDHLHKQGLM